MFKETSRFSPSNYRDTDSAASTFQLDEDFFALDLPHRQDRLDQLIAGETKFTSLKDLLSDENGMESFIALARTEPSFTANQLERDWAVNPAFVATRNQIPTAIVNGRVHSSESGSQLELRQFRVFGQALADSKQDLTILGMFNQAELYCQDKGINHMYIQGGLLSNQTQLIDYLTKSGWQFVQRNDMFYFVRDIQAN